MFLIFATILSTLSFAQNNDEPEIIYKDVTEINIEGVEVEGVIVKPQNSLIVERKRATFNPLIKLRANFTSEISQTVNAVQ